MFGIGGGELILIMFAVLMLFGADKVPEIARTIAKIMAQFKNATNDIKNEIQKGAEASGFDKNTLNNLTGNISSEIQEIKNNLLNDMPNPVKEITNEVEEIKENILNSAPNPAEEIKKETENTVDDITGPIKRNM